MAERSSRVHPHDVGLPAAIVRKRRQARRVASWMLTVAVLTAIVGWLIFGKSVWSSIRVQQESPWQAILAWAVLIVSSVTLVLGLWYLLLAQVHRIARMVEADEMADGASELRCHNCGWPHDAPDRFCRHCGKALGAEQAAQAAAGRVPRPANRPLEPDRPPASA